MAATTLFEKYGGFGSISRVVMAFYDALLDSDEVGDFFDGVDMSKLIDHQTKFIASLLGGPAAYTDAQIQQMHQHLAINDAHFDEMKRLLAETLDAHGFAAEDRDLALGAIEARRALLVRGA